MPCNAYLSLHTAIEQACKEAGIVVHIKQEIPTVSDSWEIAKKLSELVELHSTPNTTYQEYGWSPCTDTEKWEPIKSILLKRKTITTKE